MYTNKKRILKRNNKGYSRNREWKTIEKLAKQEMDVFIDKTKQTSS
jgi:hypothetical protein